MNIANVLTISRIFLAIAMVFFLEENSFAGNCLGAIVFTIASLTDFCDGYLARTKGLVSDFGKIMDPVADKVLLLSAFGVLAHIGVVAWWMFIMIAIREVAVTVSRLMAMRQGQVVAAERAGKIKTVVQIVAVSVILLYLMAQQSEYCASWFYNVQRSWINLNNILMFVAVIMTVYSGVEYFKNNKLNSIRHPEQSEGS